MSTVPNESQVVRCCDSRPHTPHLTTFAPETGIENGRCPGVEADEIVAAAVEAIDHFYADTVEEALILLSMWSRRDELTTAQFAQLVTALYGDDEAGSALISLWDRRDRLTAAEITAVRAMANDDGGLAERYLERMHAQLCSCGDEPDPDCRIHASRFRRPCGDLDPHGEHRWLSPAVIGSAAWTCPGVEGGAR